MVLEDLLFRDKAENWELGGYEITAGWERGLKEQNSCISTFLLELLQMEVNEGKNTGK